ncbi:peptidylprolyl isomerase [Acanthopleuribacter pedis]|nr:peptidylprolyl isomerase [Acanthopleuribacter pedis]
MRKNETARNVVIVLVCIALGSYVLFSFGEAPPTAQGDTIATIGSTTIKRRDALIQEINYRNQFRGMDAAQVDQFVVSSLVRGAILQDGAEALDMAVSDDELRDLIIRIRTDGEGNFAGNEDYANYIRRQYRMPVTAYEQYLREKALLGDKFRQLFVGSAYVSEEEIRERFTEENRKVTLEYVTVRPNNIQSEVSLDDNQLKKLYDENPDEFLTGEQRQIKFVSWVLSDLRDEMTITDQEALDYYNTNQDRYRQPEQVQASHVLVKTGQGFLSDEEAQKKIGEVQEALNGGMEFAEAAKKFSDDSNASRGGDLGFFKRGTMVKPFSDKVWSMAEGEVSEPVKTQFGYHIIQRVAYKPEEMQDFDAVRDAITNELKNTKAREEMSSRAANFVELANSDGFEAAAEKQGAVVQESLFFDSDPSSEMGPTLKSAAAARNAAFALAEEGDVSPAVQIPNGQVVMTWTATREGQKLSFENNKSRVRTLGESLAQKAFIMDFFDALVAAAEKEPEKSLQELKGDREWAKDNFFQVTNSINANGLPYQLRNSVDFNEDIFPLAPGEFLAQREFEAFNSNHYLLVRLKEKEDVNMDDLQEKRFQIAQQIQGQSGGDFLNAYLFERTVQYDPKKDVEKKLLSSVGGRR